RGIRSLAALAAALLVLAAARGDDWPQWMGPGRDDVWRETGILPKFPPGGPKVLWRAEVAGGYAGPAGAGGRVAGAEFVREGRAAKEGGVGAPSAIKGKERVLCFDAATGAKRWEHASPCEYRIDYPAGPRCTPTVTGGKVYTLGAM